MSADRSTPREVQRSEAVQRDGHTRTCALELASVGCTCGHEQYAKEQRHADDQPEQESPNFTPAALRELEARGFVRVNVPRRESPSTTSQTILNTLKET